MTTICQDNVVGLAGSVLLWARYTVLHHVSLFERAIEQQELRPLVTVGGKHTLHLGSL